MLKLGQGEYRLCLLDTNAISEMVKRPRQEFRHYVEWSMRSQPICVPAFSVFTLLELRQSPSVYSGFAQLFNVYPCLVLKSFDELIADEVRAYPDPSHINPILVGFAGQQSKAQLGEVLDELFRTPDGLQQERYWNDSRQNIVDGIASLVSNYLPDDGSSYTPEEIRTFVEVAGFAQIAMRHYEFAQQVVDAGEAVDVDAFPAVKASTFTVFEKFYADRARKPSRSDAFDIIIAAATPYVDAVITEAHQAEALRKIQRRDSFMNHVSVFALRDFRESAPRR